MALRSLKIKPMVSPTILKGSKISHSRGRRNSSINASGQHTTSKRHQRIRATNVLMMLAFDILLQIHNQFNK